MERTRFKCNGKPIFVTSSRTLIYTDKHGYKLEQCGMAPIVQLAEIEDVIDETGWNIRYVRPGSVAYEAAMKNGDEEREIAPGEMRM